MKTILVIPARYHSSRLPGKPLIDLNGKSMIERTFLQCSKAFPNNDIYVATDDSRIEKHCLSKGIQVVITSDKCLTGTDRIAEVAQIIEADYYINVQGDEPIINPEDIKLIVEVSGKNPKKILNGYTKINNDGDFYSSSIPKVVVRPDGRLLYMSRAPIPSNKNQEFVIAWRQVCIYGFPKSALREFATISSKTVLENNEDIEILRFLEMGNDVHMIEMSDISIAVDTPADVEKVLKYLKENGK